MSAHLRNEHVVVAMLRQYLVALTTKWVFWVFLFLDFIGIPLLIVNVLRPNTPLPTWVLWIIFAVAVFCFALANFLVFRDQEVEKERLRSHIDELESVEAKLKLKEVSSGFSPGHGGKTPSFVDVELDQYGYELSGVPGWAAVWINIEVENIGYKPGELDIELDRDRSWLPPIFGLDMSTEPYPNGPIPSQFRPQSRFTVSLALDIPVVERDPLAFAKALRQLDTYRLVLPYSTKRIGGVSDIDELVLEGDLRQFRQEIIKHWEGFRFQELAHIAEEN